MFVTTENNRQAAQILLRMRSAHQTKMMYETKATKQITNPKKHSGYTSHMNPTERFGDFSSDRDANRFLDFRERERARRQQHSESKQQSNNDTEESTFTMFL